MIALRSAALPWLGGGALLVGYAAFSWLRSHKPRLESKPPTASPRPVALGEDSTSVFRSPERPSHIARRELDLQPGEDEEYDSVVPENLGALFLARATEALSPLSRHLEDDEEQNELPFEASLSEGSARAARAWEASDYGESAERDPLDFDELERAD